jgi:hypothetical protein
MEEHMRSPLSRLPLVALSLFVVSALFAPIASAKAPSVTTGAVKANGPYSAFLNGTVNPNGIATGYRFEWGETESYGSHLPYWWEESAIGSGTSDVKVSQQIPTLLYSPLNPSTVYHYRLIALNGKNEWTYGKDKIFKLSPPTPLSVYAQSDENNVGVANLYASVNPYGLDTTYQFEWGPTKSYGNKVPASPKSLGSGGETVTASEKLSGLEPYTYYHFRVVFTNEMGTTASSDQMFMWGEE